MKKSFIVLGMLASTAPVYGILPTAGYVAEYLGEMCHNPILTIPGIDSVDLVAEKYLLNIIDGLNKNNVDYWTKENVPTTYAVDAITDNIISIGYLVDSMRLLRNSMDCCMGGAVDVASGECRACGTWTWDDSTQCPSGFDYVPLANTVWAATAGECPAGTEVYFEIPDTCLGEVF